MKKALFVTLTIFIVGFVIFKCMEKQESKGAEAAEEILLRYGDPISNISYRNLDNENQLIDNTSGYKMIFYIDPYCESCVKNFEIIERMNAILGNDLSINILWRQSPKEDIIEKTGISGGNQYILDKTSLLNSYPTYFIVDKNGKIILCVDDISRVIKKIIELNIFSEDKIISETNDYLYNKISKQNNKPLLVYFAMEGCKDCEMAENMMDQNNIHEKYNVLTIYTEESYGEQEFVDVGRLFLEIYGIEWYPSFLIMDHENVQFVGKNSIENLREILAL